MLTPAPFITAPYWKQSKHPNSRKVNKVEYSCPGIPYGYKNERTDATHNDIGESPKGKVEPKRSDAIECH